MVEEEEISEEVVIEGIRIPRQIHLVTGLHQVAISSEDPTEHLDILLDRALFAMDVLREIRREDIDDGIG